MSVRIRLFHRTSIAEARSILKDGFADAEWDFGLRDAHTGEPASAVGVWLSDRPLGEQEGLTGDALLEVTLELSEDELKPYELEGMLWNARFWVAPAPLINTHGKARIAGVDPRTSWDYEVWKGDG